MPRAAADVVVAAVAVVVVAVDASRRPIDGLCYTHTSPKTMAVRCLS